MLIQLDPFNISRPGQAPEEGDTVSVHGVPYRVTKVLNDTGVVRSLEVEPIQSLSATGAPSTSKGSSTHD